MSSHVLASPLTYDAVNAKLAYEAESIEPDNDNAVNAYDAVFAMFAKSAYVLNDPVRNVVTEFGVIFTLYWSLSRIFTEMFGTSTVKFSSFASRIMTRMFGTPGTKVIYYLVAVGRTTKYPSRTRRVIEPLVILISYTYFL